MTHIFFASDDYMFFRGMVEEGNYIKECLRMYERAPSQEVNFQKSSIQFSRNTGPDIADIISYSLQVPIPSDDFYLGLPKLVVIKQM